MVKILYFVFQKIFDTLSLKLGREAKLFDANSINDESIRRKLEILSQIGTSILEDNDLEKYNGLTNEMSKIYRSAHVPTQQF